MELKNLYDLTDCGEFKFLDHIMLLYYHRCLGSKDYPYTVSSYFGGISPKVRIMPNGYELLYILNHFDISESIEQNLPISIIIKKYRNEI